LTKINRIQITVNESQPPDHYEDELAEYNTVPGNSLVLSIASLAKSMQSLLNL
jgi:hypothetical protein